MRSKREVFFQLELKTDLLLFVFLTSAKVVFSQTISNTLIFFQYLHFFSNSKPIVVR